MDAILTDSVLVAPGLIEKYILVNVIEPKLQHAGEVWEGDTEFIDQLETVQMATTKEELSRCPSTISKRSTMLRAERGMYHTKYKWRREEVEMTI